MKNYLSVLYMFVCLATALSLYLLLATDPKVFFASRIMWPAASFMLALGALGTYFYGYKAMIKKP